MNIKQLLIAVCIGTMFAACSSRDDYSAANDDTIKLRATVVEPTIATRVEANNAGVDLQTLPSGERVRVRFYKSGEAKDIITDTYTPTDFYYTIGSNNTLTADGEEPSWGDNTLDIVAFYPETYCDDGPGGGANAFLVQTNQSDIENYRKSDLLMAYVLGQTKANGPITLPFKHALSKIIVKLDGTGSGLNVGSATNVNLTALNGYTIDSNLTHSLSVSFAPGSTIINLGDYNENGVAGIIPPQQLPLPNYEYTDAFITFVIDGIKYKFDPTTSITLKGGYQYTFTVLPLFSLVGQNNNSKLAQEKKPNSVIYLR